MLLYASRTSKSGTRNGLRETIANDALCFCQSNQLRHVTAVVPVVRGLLEKTPNHSAAKTKSTRQFESSRLEVGQRILLWPK